MLLSMAVLLFFGLIGSLVFQKMKLPGLLGMLLMGIVIGPYGLDWLHNDLMNVSADLRMIALIIILLRAGLGLNRRKIQAVGPTALYMSFIPGILEATAIAFMAMWLLGFSFVQGGILGFIIAAVSPAVVVPSMLMLMDKRIGTNKNIPTMILSAASLDDVFAITFFSTFLGLYFGTGNLGFQVMSIPLAIFLGVMLGILAGLFLVWLFNKIHLRDSKKVVLILSLAFFLVALEHALDDFILIASLLGVMAIGLAITERKVTLGQRLSIKFNKIWVFAEIFLFVLVGAEVDLSVAIEAGIIGLFILLVGLLFRSMGVLIATSRSIYSLKERMFIVTAYWPKATVQAAIGSIPLSLGVTGGEIILALSVMSIILSAPLGAFMIAKLSKVFLVREDL